MIKSSGESLLGVINDILDFSKIEAGKLSVEVIPFDLSDCLATTLKLLATRAHLKGLELASDIRSHVPTALLGDPGRLRQIIVNLVGNAIKFTAHGEVVLSVDAEAHTEGHVTLRFDVSDTGIGVAPEHRAAIFQPFVQSDSSTTRTHGGTGLGLAISTNLVGLLGGRIWLDSELGRGSTFHVALPFALQQPQALDARAIDAQAKPLYGMRILVADDNAVNRRILEVTLTRWGMRPVVTAGGQAALDAMQQHKDAGRVCPVVILDGHMPDIDGFAVADAMNSDSAFAGVAILMLTSAGQPGDAARCRTLGISAYLVKPTSEVDLRDALLAAVGLPSMKGEAVLPITRHAIRESQGKLRILLAEDNVVNQLIARRLLEKRGHMVVIAANGRAALAALEVPGAVFDLILMDVQMPDIDGFEVTALIRARENAAGTHLPIIAMTAHAMAGDEERYLAAGMDGHVAKPFQINEVFATIDRVLSRNG